MFQTLSIPRNQWVVVVELYKSGFSMQKVADKLNVSIDAVTYVLRKSNIPRRSSRESNRIVFEAKKPSFAIRSRQHEQMNLIGAMLYWAEGYKRETASGIDFANSDADMAQVFWEFMKHRYTLDYKRLYFSVYYYDDQTLTDLIKFWQRKLGVTGKLFRHSYMKKNSKSNARKLSHGVLHIRYTDKKMLWDVLNLIKSYKVKFCVGGGAV